MGNEISTDGVLALELSEMKNTDGGILPALLAGLQIYAGICAIAAGAGFLTAVIQNETK